MRSNQASVLIYIKMIHEFNAKRDETNWIGV